MRLCLRPPGRWSNRGLLQNSRGARRSGGLLPQLPHEGHSLGPATLSSALCSWLDDHPLPSPLQAQRHQGAQMLLPQVPPRLRGSTTLWPCFCKYLFEMVEGHHWLNGSKSEQTLGDGEGQEAWRAAARGVSESRTRPGGWTTTATLKLFQILWAPVGPPWPASVLPDIAFWIEHCWRCLFSVKRSPIFPSYKVKETSLAFEARVWCHRRPWAPEPTRMASQKLSLPPFGNSILILPWEATLSSPCSLWA